MTVSNLACDGRGWPLRDQRVDCLRSGYGFFLRSEILCVLGIVGRLRVLSHVYSDWSVVRSSI